MRASGELSAVKMRPAGNEDVSESAPVSTDAQDGPLRFPLGMARSFSVDKSKTWDNLPFVSTTQNVEQLGSGISVGRSDR